MRTMMLVVIAAAACGTARSEHGREAAQAAVLGASTNAAKLEALMRGDVVNGGIAFADPACARFAEPGPIARDQVHAFAACVAGLGLRPSGRVDALPDVTVLTYGPGFELEARVVDEPGGDHLSWIGFAGRRVDGERTATVEPAVLEALRIGGDANGPLEPDVAQALELDRMPKLGAVAFAWLKVCVDPAGRVSGVYPREATSPRAAHAFAAAAMTWQFRPFVVGGAALPACAVVLSAYPTSAVALAHPERLPFPTSGASADGHDALEMPSTALFAASHRTGDAMIVPSDRDKSRIHHSRIRTVNALFRLCLDRAGHVESILPVRSSGLPDYDRAIVAGMQSWRYTPVLDETNAPIPVCSTVQFIYSQS